MIGNIIFYTLLGIIGLILLFCIFAVVVGFFYLLFSKDEPTVINPDDVAYAAGYPNTVRNCCCTNCKGTVYSNAERNVVWCVKCGVIGDYRKKEKT